jgi:hypothetical protein
MKPSNVCDVLNLVKYLQNAQDASFFEAPASESFSGGVRNNTEAGSEYNSSSTDE